jgi:hypothetical protein
LLEDDIAAHKRAAEQADLVFATVSGSTLLEYGAPGTLIQDKLLDLVRHNDAFVLYKRFSAPNGKSFFLFERKRGDAPSIVSVLPTEGEGPVATISVRVLSPKGVNNLKGIMMLVGSQKDPKSCLIFYEPRSRGIAMAANSARDWLPILAAGSAGLLENGRCIINLANSEGSEEGNLVRLTMRMKFKAGFSGMKNIYVYADDRQGHATGWQLWAKWNIK